MDKWHTRPCRNKKTINQRLIYWLHKLTLATCESKLSIFWTIRLNKYNMNQAQLLLSLCCGTYKMRKNNFLVMCKIKRWFCKIQKLKLPEVASKSAWPVFLSLDKHFATVHFLLACNSSKWNLPLHNVRTCPLETYNCIF